MVTSNKGALALLMKLTLIVLFGIVIVGAVAISILGGEASFADTYQSAIQLKYEKLINTKEPKIVIVGGSNAGFGIDSVLMEEQTGYPVVNMGLHAGFGNLFNIEIAKKHIEPEDIVILAFEYGLNSSSFEKLGGIELIMEGIDNNLQMYREIPLKNMPEILGNLFSYAQKKASPRAKATGVYSSSSFDEFGNMILERKEYVIVDYEKKVDIYNKIYGDQLLATDDKLEYLKELRDYIEEKGASVFFTAPVLLENAYEGTEQNLLDYAASLEQMTGIQFISDPNNYVLPSKYMFDTIYHCNEMGEKRRTEQLVYDLQAAGIVD